MVVNPNTFENVHIFDGKLQNIFYPKKYYMIEEKEILFAKLAETLTDVQAKNMLQIITNDLKHLNGGENYQPENKLDASDILAEILESEYDLCLLQEQLADASQLGRCPAGRVTRLLQVWLTIEKKD